MLTSLAYQVDKSSSVYPAWLSQKSGDACRNKKARVISASFFPVSCACTGYARARRSLNNGA
jgi:hypothetical protein